MTQFDTDIADALGPCPTPQPEVRVVGDGSLPSYFDVNDLVIASISAAAREMAALTGSAEVEIDRRLALKWFDMTLRPLGWDMPGAWDPVAGDYPTRDGWIRLHTNSPHHRDAALKVLRCPGDRNAVAKAVREWTAGDLETAIVAAQGCAVEMRGLSDWAVHPQGQAVAREPLIEWSMQDTDRAPRRPGLDGIRVLDLTRVLAGPVATRFLAGFGAIVLRIDPPGWAEPGVEPEITLGKRCAALDLKQAADRDSFVRLLAQADVLVHGYRPGALDGLDLGSEARQKINPRLIDVSLNAYGWTGPWKDRRGFDSLVQMSCGIASEGMTRSQTARPKPLPVQALDHATGYLMAAAVLRALRWHAASGQVARARVSLARTAHLLTSAGAHELTPDLAAETATDLAAEVEATGWGPAHRIRFPVTRDGRGPTWPHPAGPLLRSRPVW